ncbi:MAG: hypothetical protein EOO01_33275 [Chitinophagaceae bacterium]|nr:MAG: hypothetical protein EOO01_33275 [Chitinophagaceae bacterium]
MQLNLRNSPMPVVSIIVLSILFAACDGEHKPKPGLMADLQKTDSLELIFFRSPDSLRYFTYLPLTDGQFIGSLVRDLQQDTIPGMSCMKEGKIYLFKNGQIFNTVFFGYADKHCTFLRYINNGRLHTYAMSEAFRAEMENKKKLAKEPVASVGANEPAISEE